MNLMYCTSNSLVDAPLEAESYPKTFQSHRQPVLADALRDAPFTIRLALSFQLLLPYSVQLHVCPGRGLAVSMQTNSSSCQFLKPPSAPNRIGAGTVICSSSPDCRVRERKMSRTRMSYLWPQMRDQLRAAKDEKAGWRPDSE